MDYVTLLTDFMILDRRVRRTNENLVLAAYNSIEKRDEMTTRKAVFGVTVTGEASFRYHS